MSVVLVCGFSVLVGSFVQGALGFGFGMVCMSIMPLVLELKAAVAVVAVVGLLVNGGVLFQTRAHLDHRKYWPLLAGSFVGIPCGVTFLHLAPENLLTAVLGIIILAYVGWRMIGQVQFESVPDQRWGVAAGIVGGALGGAFNTSGPPAVMYVSGRSWDPGAVKATMQIFFCLNSVVQLTLFGSTGLLTEEVLTYDLVLVPFVLLGVWVGGRFSNRFTSRIFEHLVLAGLGVLGVVFLFRSMG